jgi:hypothetical protein
MNRLWPFASNVPEMPSPLLADAVAAADGDVVVVGREDGWSVAEGAAVEQLVRASTPTTSK